MANKKHLTLSRNNKRNRRIQFNQQISQLLDTPYNAQQSLLSKHGKSLKI